MSQMAGEAKPVLDLMTQTGCNYLDLKFVDMPGTWQHVTVPRSEVNDDLFVRGTGFDGSSIRGFQAINESDMLLVPVASTARKDPFMADTVTVIADVRDPLTSKDYPRDPRYVARKAEAYLKQTGIGDVCYIGPELEFFIFDSARFDQTMNSGYYFIDSEEGIWRSGAAASLDGKGPNIANKIRPKEGYFPVPPQDTFQEIRNEAGRWMEHFGIILEKHHHEVATAGQGEIDMRYAPLVQMADQVMLYKYCLKNTARQHGKVCTFMPKPLFGDNGTGMHTHQSIWKRGRPLFAGNKYAGLSDLGLNYIGGLLHHGPALMAILAPTSNSYKRLVPGFEAPTLLALSARNRSAAARIPVYFPDAKAKRVEFRPPDPACNPYLAFSAMLMAGLDGIDKKMDPGAPIEKDLYELPAEELAKIRQVPGSLEESLKALENDHDFLLKGGVFTEDLIETYIEFKRRTQVDAVRIRPHPYEFFLSFDA
jgi:glutamine synthetase